MSSDELIRLARVLSADTDGRPRWVARNRAVSTAYYALFHALAELCGRELVGAWKPWPAFRHVYRSLDHGHARRVLDAARRDGNSSEAVKTVGDAFTDLQERRHAADYDPGYRITSADTGSLVTNAERAVRIVKSLPSADGKLLAARLIGRTRN